MFHHSEKRRRASRLLRATAYNNLRPIQVSQNGCHKISSSFTSGRERLMLVESTLCVSDFQPFRFLDAEKRCRVCEKGISFQV